MNASLNAMNIVEQRIYVRDTGTIGAPCIVFLHLGRR